MNATKDKVVTLVSMDDGLMIAVFVCKNKKDVSALNNPDGRRVFIKVKGLRLFWRNLIIQAEGDS